MASLSEGFSSPSWRCLLIKSGVLGLIVVLIRHRCGHPDSGKSSKESWQQTPLRRRGLVWNPGGTIIIVFDRDPVQICTCVKMNQAWAVNLWTEIFMMVVWREATGFFCQGWERNDDSQAWIPWWAMRRIDWGKSGKKWIKYFTPYCSCGASLWLQLQKYCIHAVQLNIKYLEVKSLQISVKMDSQDYYRSHLLVNWT